MNAFQLCTDRCAGSQPVLPKGSFRLKGIRFRCFAVNLLSIVLTLVCRSNSCSSTPGRIPWFRTKSTKTITSTSRSTLSRIMSVRSIYRAFVNLPHVLLDETTATNSSGFGFFSVKVFKPCSPSKFNIVSIAIQTLTQIMRSDPISAFASPLMQC